MAVHFLSRRGANSFPSWTVVAAAFAVGLGGCGGKKASEGDSRSDRCRQLHVAACESRVRCKVYQDFSDPSAGVIDPEFCAEIESAVVDACVTVPAFEGMETATDAELRACLNGFHQYACSDLCGNIAPDPPACAAVKSVPSTTRTECAP